MCHDTLGFKGLDIRSRPFNFYPEFRAVIFSSSDQQPTCSPAMRARRIAANIAKLPELLGRKD
jgi:hypothetical protein